jgi:hypothetical protein
MNENIKTIKLITLNLLTNFIAFPLYLKRIKIAYYIKQIKEILENPKKYYQSTYTKENQKKINLIENIDEIFS